MPRLPHKPHFPKYTATCNYPSPSLSLLIPNQRRWKQWNRWKRMESLENVYSRESSFVSVPGWTTTAACETVKWPRPREISSKTCKQVRVIQRPNQWQDCQWAKSSKAKAGQAPCRRQASWTQKKVMKGYETKPLTSWSRYLQVYMLEMLCRLKKSQHSKNSEVQKPPKQILGLLTPQKKTRESINHPSKHLKSTKKSAQIAWPFRRSLLGCTSLVHPKNA